MADEPLEPIPLDEEEGGPVKTFLEHLEDLRWVLIKCFSALLLGMVTCLAGASAITTILTEPVLWAGLTEQAIGGLSPLSGFTISMKMALWGGITLALPFILYFVGEFVVPALKKNERKYFLGAFAVGSILFLAGMLLCYFVILPISLKGLVAYNNWIGIKTELWRAEEYFQFVIMFMVGMGLSFEIPVLILTLVRLGIIPHGTLVKGRAYFFIANLVLCSFITPDPVSTIFMVLPVQLLLEICILISKHWERQKRLAEAAELAASKQLHSGA